MALFHRGRAPRRLLGLLLVVTLIPGAALAWLTWRILEQDRALERQRAQDRLERTADVIAGAIARRLSEIEDRLPSLWTGSSSTFPQHAVIVSFSADDVETRPQQRLSYLPIVAPVREPAPNTWEAGEAFEFRDRNYARAVATFKELAQSKDPAVRAGALVRLGRNLRKTHRYEEALAAYAELERLASTTVEATPAELLAREARSSVLQTMGNIRERERTATSVYADLLAGRWKLDRVAYEFHVREARRQLGTAPVDQAEPDGLVLAAAVETLWQQWPALQREPAGAHGRRSLWVNGQPVLVVWRRNPENLLALVANRQYMEAEWDSIWRGQGAIALTDRDGHAVLGSMTPTTRPQTVRAAEDTNLPWTMRVASDNDGPAAASAGRQTFLLAGLGIVAFVVVVASWAALRAAAREAAVAQIQSDFVSAVSHEFRTPLTSMRHLTELLRDDVVREEPRRHQYYGVLARETERLQRLVESLLDFGRMEAGAHEYRFESIDPTALVERVVDEFQTKLGGARVISIGTHGCPARIRADGEAIGRALWNLLDNAVKYSPADAAVRVELSEADRQVAIRVIDRGGGIPAGERTHVFEKFVRGAASRESSVQGTGIGLAMVRQIVSAHGGDVQLESEPGRGSAFTIVLPAVPDVPSSNAQSHQPCNQQSEVNLKSGINLKSALRQAQGILSSSKDEL